jgi:hypothetical protein
MSLDIVIDKKNKLNALAGQKLMITSDPLELTSREARSIFFFINEVVRQDVSSIEFVLSCSKSVDDLLNLGHTIPDECLYVKALKAS